MCCLNCSDQTETIRESTGENTLEPLVSNIGTICSVFILYQTISKELLFMPFLMKIPELCVNSTIMLYTEML